ncbi:MAG: DNA-directed RNA polymerase subunit omega [Alphaproteobacteria bacterium]|nr:DNA-directed RNA polymerase subunit omega [Alphaproteobacteria bacterium]
MARITINDCLAKISDKYRMITLTAQRARQLYNGATPTIKSKKDRRTVIALREIAEGTINPEQLEKNFIASFRRITPATTLEESSEENDDLRAIEAELN